MRNVTIQATGKSWAVLANGKHIATVKNGWMFISLCKIKGWNIENKTALIPEIAEKI